MATDICPGENATECLLRAILETQIAARNEMNWDPITLVFTAVISVLALVFTVLTVVQGVLAAGPRSLKASESAIGWYSRYSASSFSMSEMRVRSVAFTPVLQTTVLQMYNINSHSLSSKIRKGSRILKDWMKGVQWVPGILWGVKAVGPHPPAGWVALMEHTNIIGVQNFHKKAFYTEYLPRDLLAPPAYAEVFCISVLALLSGCTTLEIDNKGYPHMEGLYTRLYFRDHSELGDVAVYQHFHNIPGLHNEEGPEISAVSKAFWYCQGYLRFDDTSITRNGYPDAYLSVSGGISELEMKAILGRMRTAVHNGYIPYPDRVYESAFRASWEYVGVLLGSVDILTIPAYPSGKIELVEIVRELGTDLGFLPVQTITSGFLNSLAEEFSSYGFSLHRLGIPDAPGYELSDNQFQVRKPCNPWLERARKCAKYLKRDPESESTAALVGSSHERADGYYDIVLDFLEARRLIRWIQNPKGPDQPTPRPSIPGSSSPSGIMLSMLDHFIGTYAATLALKAFWDILATDALPERPLPKGVSVADLELLQVKRPEVAELNFIKKLLWLRAVCLAGFLYSLPDISPLVDTDLGRRLVPVL